MFYFPQYLNNFSKYWIIYFSRDNKYNSIGMKIIIEFVIITIYYKTST